MSYTACVYWTAATVFVFFMWLPLAIGFNPPEYRAWWPFLNLLLYASAALLGGTIGCWIARDRARDD